ncbi:HNH endonuclease signature motif containing protein [Nocardioides panacihumi]|uniref:HNH endonuclease signature motif containing protein n=1 Tax=Nocardioides panacihumi TaxID=400774 RepID=A0ABN2RMX0_9ACTN
MTAADAEPPRRPAATRRHVMHRFLGRLHEVFEEVSTDTAWALTPEELAECLCEAYAAQGRLAALTLGLVAQADRSGLPAYDGEVSLVAWLRDRVRLAPAEAKRQIRLASRLEHHDVTRRALGSGAFPVASAAVIMQALDALPADVDPTVIEEAEAYLAGEAHAHDSQALRRLAAHLHEVIDPDGADQRLAEQLARAEAEAARQCFLQLRHDEGTATSEGTFRIPLLQGVKLQRMLESLTNPGRPDPIESVDPETGVQVSAEERRGRAFLELIDRIPTKKLPELGGSDPTVVVTMELGTLLGGPQAAQLDTRHAISPGLARRLAAQAGVIPAVLGSSSEVLDLGRQVRFHRPKQRLAMAVTQGGTCAVHTCTRSAVGADAHHLIPWHEGGPTNTADGVLICPRHHTFADHPDHQVIRLRPGRIQIHRRC